MEVTNYIPRERFNLWYELFKKSSGRLLCNPIDGDRVYVRYVFEDMDSYTELQQNFQRLTTQIVETKSGFWKKLKAKLKYKVGQS